MRWRGGRRSKNIQDLRGQSGGRRRGGLGGLGGMLGGGRRGGRMGGGRKGGIGLNCLVPEIGGALFSQVWKDALWDRYFTGAPARQRRSVEQYKIVKRA